jgi:hypothetical protein
MIRTTLSSKFLSVSAYFQLEGGPVTIRPQLCVNAARARSSAPFV